MSASIHTAAFRALLASTAALTWATATGHDRAAFMEERRSRPTDDEAAA